MNRSETATLLGLCAAYDRRTTGDADVIAWADILADLRLEDCVLAVKGWYATTATIIMPSDIRSAVKKIRNERIAANAHHLVPPDDIGNDPSAYMAWLKYAYREAGNGIIPERVLTPARPMPALETVFRTVPHE